MAYWDCPRCAAENSLDETSCWRCGFQHFPGYGGAAPGDQPPGQRHESVEKERRNIREALEKAVERGRDRAKTEQ